MISYKFRIFENSIVTAFFYFLAFNYALTIPILFPLKISEIALAILLFIIIIKGKIKVHVLSHKAHVALLAFISYIAVSTLINFFWRYDYPLNAYDSRFGYKLDSLLKFTYLLLAYLAFIVSSNALTLRPQKYLFFFISGSLLAAIYSWYIFISSFLAVPYLRLPGMDAEPQVISFLGHVVIRAGTFKEGNYMGLFLLVAGIVAFYVRKLKYAVFFFLTIVTTVSTTAILAMCLFFALHCFHKYFNKKNAGRLVLLVVAALAVFVLLLQVPSFRTNITDKIFGSTENLTQASYSKADRLNTTITALKMGLANPVFGVGLSNYALHYPQYLHDARFDNRPTKVIPNNVYAELFSETGLIGLLLFILFVFYLLKAALRDQTRILRNGLVVILFYFFAFPTFTILFLWFYFGLIASLKYTIAGPDKRFVVLKEQTFRNV